MSAKSTTNQIGTHPISTKNRVTIPAPAINPAAPAFASLPTKTPTGTVKHSHINILPISTPPPKIMPKCAANHSSQLPTGSPVGAVMVGVGLIGVNVGIGVVVVGVTAGAITVFIV